ncbi:hypothetical protein MLC59_01190 [Marinobacter bryozoorum]|uniref:hypothetical protein n=1 Tax=Marinobacter bryozoorum TaxID=256324 RepID=UPI002004FBA4|nr:hypothetical protein [Marinobacter bryozoorum]MCK7542784.1 hypothetical protein [Marinobacter bryozoorum]
MTRSTDVRNSYQGVNVNSLSTADTIDGQGGNDTLDAILTAEAGYWGPLDVQPTIRNVEDIKFEARDGISYMSIEDYLDGDSAEVIVDAKDIADVDKIGSSFSDGDLVIENLTTLTSNGQARNTEEVTVTMDHTDNFNSDGDASDLTVYFDEDYLLAGQSRTTSQANYWLLDEDSQDYQNAPLLNIERFGVSLNLDGEPVDIAMPVDVAEAADTWEAFAAGLQASIDQQVADGNSALEGLSVVVDRTNTDATYNDFGNLVTIPAITIIDSLGRELEPTGFLSPEDATGAFDIYGDFDNQPSQQLDKPVTVNVDLHKVGREGEGGNLVIGGKSQDADEGNGIEVFNIDVLGADNKPSNLGMISSTNGALRTVNIATADEYVAGETHASLTVRGENDYGDDLPFGGTVDMINATQFLGDLTIGNENAAQNVNTLNATGGGNVWFDASLTEAGSFNYTTGAGNDSVMVTVSAEPIVGNQVINVNTGSGDDMVDLTVFNNASATVVAGSGNDVVYTDNTGAKSSWTVDLFSADEGETPAFDLYTLSEIDTDYTDSRAILYGAQIAVTFSDASSEALGWNDGYESVVDILGPGEVLGDATDINEAIKRAINEDAVLSKLLMAGNGPDGSLVITSKVDGVFNEQSLQFKLLEADALDEADARYVRPGQQDTIEQAVKEAVSDSTYDFQAGHLQSEQVANAQDGFFAEEGGYGSNGTVVDLGAGSDLVVLSTEANSSETIKFSEYGNGFNTIVNFTDATGESGVDSLDFSNYLVTKEQNPTSDSTSEISQVLVKGGYSNTEIDANQVTFWDFDGDAPNGETFDGITSTNLLAALNGDEAYGDITDIVTDFSDGDYVGNAYKAVLMIEDDGDDGAYQAWDLTVGLNSDGDTVATQAQLIGTYDFGDSVDMTQAV